MKKESDKGYASSFSVIVIFIALALLGFLLAVRLPVRLSPSESMPEITVSFSMERSSARVVESKVTSHLESLLGRIEGVTGISSRSTGKGGDVTLEFERGTDMQKARFEVSSIVRRAWSEFPPGTRYPSVSVNGVDDSSSSPFMSYTINADIPPSEIMEYTERNVKPIVSAVAGVESVRVYGASPMEWRIEYDAAALERLGITPDEVGSIISSHTQARFLGVLPERADDSGMIRVAISPFSDEGLPALDRIVLREYHGEIVTLDKVARVSHTEATPTGYFRINGLNSIYLNIYAAKDANQVELSRKVSEAIASAGIPPQFLVNVSYDASERISTELDNIYLRTGLTVLILLLFVGLITMNLRYLLLIAISLTATMGVAFVVYYLAGVEIQLYSLAGITISLNLVIDNLIVMTEHLMRRYDLKAFPAILAATLTTVGALAVVFFLDDKVMLSLKDFVIVVSVNLGVSLLTALLLVPALVARMGVSKAAPKRRLRKLPVRLMRIYGKTTDFGVRHRALMITLFVLAFGLPLFLLPEKIEKEGKWASFYNATIGSTLYTNTIRPWSDKILGGSLRLFVEKASGYSYWGRPEMEPRIFINATLPHGATLSQMNSLIMKMEQFVAGFEGVEQFQASVQSARRGSVTIKFKKEFEKNGYPYKVNSDIVSKALTMGGGTWSVYGLEGSSFENYVANERSDYSIKLTGYNYDELYTHALELADTLMREKRVRNVKIDSENKLWKDDYTEFDLALDKERLAVDSLSVADIYSAVNREIAAGHYVGSVATAGGSENVTLTSMSDGNDLWSFMNVPFRIRGRSVRLGDYASIEKRLSPPDILKENQEYQLVVLLNYIGSAKHAERVLNNILKDFNLTLPTGYKATIDKKIYHGPKEESYFPLLMLVITIIFFISAILFDSLRQPVAIIMTIPMSFIGVFLTFRAFDIRFGQGAFAAFILLCGITVNAAIYIINEYNSLRRRYPAVAPRRLYMRAFRVKIMAVFLTVLSTVLGFIPFLIGETKESFWYPFAAGTMGGLVMSLVSIFLFLPLMVLPRDRKRQAPETGRITISLEASR